MMNKKITLLDNSEMKGLSIYGKKEKTKNKYYKENFY